VTELAERMAAFGVGMAFHHHMGTVVESEADIDHLMAHTGEAVGLLFDSGHCLFAGGDPAGLLGRHLHRVVHVHCKDVRRELLNRAIAEDMTFIQAVIEGVFTVPGDGCIAFTPLLRSLREAGYSGWLVVEAEQDPRMAHPLTYARLGYRNLHETAEEAGLAVA
jgi:inosose dehydratase